MEGSVSQFVFAVFYHFPDCQTDVEVHRTLKGAVNAVRKQAQVWSQDPINFHDDKLNPYIEGDGGLRVYISKEEVKEE